jgi:hypothetical protein
VWKLTIRAVGAVLRFRLRNRKFFAHGQLGVRSAGIQWSHYCECEPA